MLWWKRQALQVPYKSPFKPTAELRFFTYEEHVGALKRWSEEEARLVEALPEDPPYAVFQSPSDGWWRAGISEISCSALATYLSMAYPFSNAQTFETAEHCVRRWYRPFEPKFTTEEEARTWLKDYLAPQKEKRIYFDAEGNEVPRGET